MITYPFTPKVMIENVDIGTTAGDLAAGKPTIMDGLSFTWGRSTSVDQPEIGSCTFTIRQQVPDDGSAPPMLDVIQPDAKIELLIVVTYPDSTTGERLVWAGSVASVNGTAAGDYAYELAVTAVELAASLADETIGDKPWPVQTAAERAERILGRATTYTAPVVVDKTVADMPLSRVDVDSQPPLAMLQNVAQSVGGVLWHAAMVLYRWTNWPEPQRIVAPYFWIEDPDARPATRQFVVNEQTGAVTIENMTGDGMGGTSLVSAADLLQDPVQWTRDKAQDLTSVDVTWREQITDDDGNPTTEDRTVTFTQPGAKIIKKMSVDTDLTSELDATRLASHWVSITSQTQGWTASGMSIDTRVLQREDPVEGGLPYLQRLDSITDLLDVRDRIGRLITIVDLPGWAPGGETTSVYVEGGTYTLQDGKWLLDLNVVDATGQGNSATFADFGGTIAKPSGFGLIRGVDAWGVAGPKPSFWNMPRHGDTAYVSAHRGGSYIVPEGTRVGRINALDLDMQVIDGGDIHATQDGVLFDMHDLTVDRTTNLTGLLADLTSTQLRQGVLDCSVWFGGGWADQPITSIAETLDDLGGTAYITLEIKSETGALENCRQAVDMITARGLTSRTLIASFTESLLQPAVDAGMETMLLGTTGTAIPGSGLASRGIRYFGGSAPSMTSETAQLIINDGIRVVTYSTEQHADVNKYKNGPSGHLYGYISDDPHYLKEHVLGSYRYRRTTDPFDALTWYHGMQPDNFDVHPNYRGHFQSSTGGGYYCAPVTSARRALLQGWACPLVTPTAYTITWEADFLQHATSAGAALVFGCPDDQPFTGDDQAGGGVGPAPGYVAFLFSSGLIRLFRRDPGQLPVMIGEFHDQTVITPGDPTRLQIVVTPTTITYSKITNPDATVTVTDSTYRGGYIHTLANQQGAAAGARWRNFTIT